MIKILFRTTITEFLSNIDIDFFRKVFTCKGLKPFHSINSILIEIYIPAAAWEQSLFHQLYNGDKYI